MRGPLEYTVGPRELGGSMKAAVKWVGEAGFAAESETGHTLMMDGASEYGGRKVL